MPRKPHPQVESHLRPHQQQEQQRPLTASEPGALLDHHSCCSEAEEEVDAARLCPCTTSLRNCLSNLLRRQLRTWMGGEEASDTWS